MKKNKKKATSSLITRNKKINLNFSIHKEIETGLVLQGTEVKSIRVNPGSFSLNEAYAKIIKQEVWLVNSHINKYQTGSHYNHEEKRDRKLLLHKTEIIRLKTAVDQKNMTVIPISAYWKNQVVKINLALAKGKDKQAKKQYLIEKDIKKDIQKTIKNMMAI
ncbi:MAG: SsrA-binding protein SmpB [Chlamydiia bacterium]|nr:SsrA-binding protein SmpB [Chlamydiia bacterium]